MSVTGSPEFRKFEALFEGAPIAIWEEDFSQVRAFVHEARLNGHNDLRAWLTEDRMALVECIRRVRILHVNRLAREFYGATTVDQLAELFPELFDDETLSTFREEILAFASGQTSFQADICTRTLSGEERLVRMNASILPDEENPWSRVILAFTDLSERQQLERSLRESEQRAQMYAASLQRTNEVLRQVNSDLEQFAYAAAHDLREPLRTISLYTQMLSHLHVETIGPAAKAALRFIVEGTGRMETLITDLLAFARAIEPPESPVATLTHTTQAVDEVLANLQAAIDNADASVETTCLPSVLAEPGHVRQVFQNLISNGIKYRHPDREPLVTISARAEDSEVVFCVADNGLGIRPEYQERIFGIFKRLHGPEIPGNGIGLALCRRIVEHYGGRIWVESEPDCGTRFYFTLPAASSASADA